MMRPYGSRHPAPGGLKAVFAASILALASPAAGEVASTGSSAPWQMHEAWTKDHAEVAHYRGKVGAGEKEAEIPMRVVTRIVRLWPDTATEVEPGSRTAGSIEAMKTTVSLLVPGLARRNDQVISYSAREDLAPLRLVVTTVDPSRAMYATWTAALGKIRFFSESWPTGEGEHHLSVTERMVFADDLPTRLRGLSRVKEGQWEIELVESLIRPSAPPPRVQPATVTVHGAEDLEVDAGRFSVQRVSVTRTGPDEQEATDTLFFDRQAPYRLVKWEQALGPVYRLAAVERVSARAIDGGTSFLERRPGDDEREAEATPPGPRRSREPQQPGDEHEE